MFTLMELWIPVVGIVLIHVVCASGNQLHSGKTSTNLYQNSVASVETDRWNATDTQKAFLTNLLLRNEQTLSESFATLPIDKNKNPLTSLLNDGKKGKRLGPKGIKLDDHKGGIVTLCNDNSFITRRLKCRQCKQCGPHEVVVSPCSSFRDTVCGRERRKRKPGNCASLFRKIQNKRKSKTSKNKRQRSFQLRRCFVYFILMQLNQKESQRQSRKRSRRNTDKLKRMKSKKQFENLNTSEKLTTKEPRVERPEAGLTANPDVSFKSVQDFPQGLEPPERFDTAEIGGKSANGDIFNRNGSSSVTPTGTAPWVFITIGVVIFIVLGTIIMFSLLYRRRKRAFESGQASKNPSRHGSSGQNYDTHRSNSTDKSTDRSKSTMSTYLSRDSERGEVYELEPLAQRNRRERASVHSLFEEVPLTTETFGIDTDKYLPRVQVITTTGAAPPEQRKSLLPACVSRNVAEDDGLTAISSKSLFSVGQDDGNRLRGGNGDFHRRYVDVDFVHNDIDIHKYSHRRSQDSPEHRCRSRSSGHSRTYVSPEREHSSHSGRKYRSERRRNESNASSATSHHSARSYISIPPTSPSENYIEAGSDDTSIRSERSTPPIKMAWLTKNLKINTKNDFGNYQASSGTQTDSEFSEPSYKTVFGTPFQFGGTFNNRGGVMQAEDSDVSLMVVSGAIPKGDYVDIYGAVFTDTTEIRRKFDFPSEESLITPVVEYHAAPNYPFQNPVCVQLPHSLPEEFDTSIIKVYTFTADERGRISLRLLPLKDRSNIYHRVDGWWEKACDGCSIHINTNHFSGYFCTLCETSSLPSICTMVFGSHVQITQSRREVRVILYIWDRRLTIKDYLERFRKHESDVDRQLLTDMQIPLLDAASSDSRLVMRMEVMGKDDDRQCWRHVFRPDGSRPLFKPLQVRKLSEIVHCCRQTDPIRVEWAVENVPQEVPSAVFQCCIDIMHVHESTSDYETAMREDNDDLMRTFYVRDLKVTPHPSQEVSQSTQRPDLKRTLSEVMNLEQTEKVCQEFGISPKDIGNFRKKYTEQENFQEKLVDECLRRHGKVNFVKQLPQILEKLCLIQVLLVLEEKKILVKDLTDFTEAVDVPCQPRREQAVISSTQTENAGGRTSDSTALKSPYRGSTNSKQRNRSVSPQYRDKSQRVSRHSQERLRLQNQVGERNDEVFVHGTQGATRELGRRGRSLRHSSPPRDDDLVVDCNNSNGPNNSNSQYAQSRYPCKNTEERQPLNYQKSSSSGSDSLLRGSSIPSGDNAGAVDSLTSSTGQSCSMIAQADSKDFAEPYPEEFLDDFQKQTYKKEIAASRNSNIPHSEDYVDAYPEIAEDLHLSSSGPRAIPPVPRTSYSTKVSCPTQIQKPDRNRSKERSWSPGQEQTSKKEVYGFQTIV